MPEWVDHYCEALMLCGSINLKGGRTMAQAKAADKKSRHRSPAYPAVGLREAVERAKKFYSVDRKAGAPPEIAVKHMGFATAHGQAMSVLAALKKFGLVSDVN